MFLCIVLLFSSYNSYYKFPSICSYIERYKSRMVVLGCRQQLGVDYIETFAPVVKLSTAIYNWIVVQMDVTNDFLHGDLHEDVYMSLPQSYTHLGCRITSSTATPNPKTGMVCHLLKILYWLKQAPRMWFSKLSYTLLADDFTQSKSDPSLFTKMSESSITLILIYVDDLLLAGNSPAAITELKAMLSRSFHMKDLGNINYFLGLEINKSVSGFFISQKKYTMDLLKEFHKDHATPLKIPIDSHLKLTPTTGDPLPDPTFYQRLLGRLVYLTVTRPNITFTVHILSQFMNKPTTAHMQAAKQLLRYLLGTSAQGLLLAASSAVQLQAYCNSDWASCPISRKSTTSFYVLIGDSPVSWRSKK